MKTVTYDETKWQMVPKVPTEEMKDAAMDILLHRGDIYANSQGNIVIETITPADLLRAMLRAAPTPPEVEQAQPVVNQQMTTDSGQDDQTLADTQRQIIEAAEQRGYARAKSE